MNSSNQLLAVLDRVFGFADKVRSTFKKVEQHFDEATNETVILLEYRVRTRGMPVARDVVADRQQKRLLQQINVMAQAAEQRRKKNKD